MFECERTWVQECGALPAPTGFGPIDTYAMMCPENPCYSTDGGGQWVNTINFDTWNAQSLEEKQRTPWEAYSLAEDKATTPVMMQSVTFSGANAGMLVRVAGGVSCLAVAAVLFVATSARRRRQGYEPLLPTKH